MLLPDPNSLSNFHEVRVSHVSLHLDVNFERKVLSGHVDLTLVKVQEHSHELILDTAKLHIKSVGRLDSNNKVHDAEYAIRAPHEVFGSALQIPLTTFGPQDKVRIVYETSPEATAIQWLSPAQTSGKKLPFLFTQCQAIHARSMIPIQDSPGNKFTYDAQITAPKELVALMSAHSTGTAEAGSDKKLYSFNQPKPIPSYLLALAVGALVGRNVGPISTIWSEAEIADACEEEFSDVHTFITTAESIAGPYEWGRYDLLVLPPSFPYGGMENPQLTFVTPTLLSGDKSNVDVVAHEISHSWTGNLVTTSTWEHFWLNEGFTVFLERKIAKKLHGQEIFLFDAMLGWKTLSDTIEVFGKSNVLTALVPKLDDVDPDDAFSSVPYEKGFNLLYYLETLVGEDKFAVFLKDWIQNHKEKGATTEEFKEYFLQHFKGEINHFIDWNAWFNSPGMPPVTPNFETARANKSIELANKWLASEEGFSSDDIKSWDALQIRAFLDQLLLSATPLKHSTLEKLDNLYHFSKSNNSEIKFPWFKLGITANWEPSVKPAIEFITSQGRMKYVRPLYRALYKSEIGKERAVETFKQHKDFYHSICTKVLTKDLELA